MQIKIKILLFFVLLGINLNAQNIVQAEYYIDTDFGFGNNVPISLDSTVQDGTFQFNVNLTEETEGVHRLYVRAMDEYNIWGLASTITFINEPVKIDSTITYGEYFFDTDPGFGSGYAIAIPSQKDVQTTFTADLSSLSIGTHTLYIRIRDDVGAWGLVAAKTIMVHAVDLSEIVQAEYFFNVDPGFGNGYNVPVNPGSTDTSIVFQPDLSSLTPGFHKMYLRTKNARNEWSITNTRVIQVTENEKAPITKLEYYFSSDTDTSDVYEFIIPIPDTNITETFSPDLSQLNENNKYNLNIRAVDSLGRKSILNSFLTTYDPLYCEAGFEFIIDAPNLSVQFADTSIGVSTGYYWEFGDDEYSNGQNPLHIYPEPGTYESCLSIFNTDSRCFSKQCEKITIGTVDTTTCYAGFTYTKNNLSFNFTSAFSNDIVGSYWKFGDGTFSYSPNPTHTYAKPGKYEVCAVVFNTNTGCQSQQCKIVEAGTIDCQAGFNVLVDRTTKKVEYVNNSVGAIDQYYWDLGDGTSMYKSSGAKVYDEHGIYDVCLSVFNKNTGCYSDICKKVDVRDTSKSSLCNAKFNYAVSSSTREVSFVESSYKDYDKWYWDFGDGNIASTKTTKHTYKEDGVYKVCLTVYNEASKCNAQLCKEITVTESAIPTVPLLKSGFSYLVDSVGFGVVFKDFSTGSVTNWYWTFGDGTYSKDQNPPKHNYPAFGRYEACLTVNNTETGATSNYCEEINVGVKTCNVVSEFNSFIDVDTREVKFSDQSKGNITSWFWSFGDGTSSTKRNPTHTYSKPGFYLVSLSVRNADDGCNDYFASFIQVGIADCKANFSYVVDADSNKITLKSTSKGDVTKYFWSFNDGGYTQGESAVHYFKGPGIYQVGLTISTTGGGLYRLHCEPGTGWKSRL